MNKKIYLNNLYLTYALCLCLSFAYTFTQFQSQISAETLASATGGVWTSRTSQGVLTYPQPRYCGNGTKLLNGVISGSVGRVYSSSNDGASFTSLTPWSASAGSREMPLDCSDDGQNIAASDGDFFYVSHDAGVTWTPNTDFIFFPGQVACSSDCSTIIGSAGFIATVWTSSNGGTNWTQRTGSSNVWAVTVSGDGTKMAIVENPGNIWTSTNSGVTWTNRTSAGSRTWRAIAWSKDGSTLVASNGGDGASSFVYVSLDNGATWTQRPLNIQGTYLDISSDGTKIVAGTSTGDGFFYTSKDKGLTWTKQTDPLATGATGVTMTLDGVKMAVGVFANYIWTNGDCGGAGAGCGSGGGGGTNYNSAWWMPF